MVRIDRTGTVSPVYALVVSTKENRTPFVLFETKEAKLMKKMQAAIGTVAQHLGAKKAF